MQRRCNQEVDAAAGHDKTNQGHERLSHAAGLVVGVPVAIMHRAVRAPAAASRGAHHRGCHHPAGAEQNSRTFPLCTFPRAPLTSGVPKWSYPHHRGHRDTSPEP